MLPPLGRVLDEILRNNNILNVRLVLILECVMTNSEKSRILSFKYLKRYIFVFAQ